ncbi:MmcQ-like protein [Paenibacillus selenitireducens]|jgi:predicted DNA-binding protein (MmcQ/YjbR family)|uniref:MmcQ-like protein n=1 Tax=Paenibacillus selenitireducens TaxID=1324314 RepID=A0A1T2X217_9BACL|nr:MmcQ/YjbR family DNA-binding protein [Paenibacillus selenitireducens]OPA73877.1 MmcQ-like protein [Paenibacillus selenitireducens]
MQKWVDYCLTKPGTSLTYPFGVEVQVFKVGTKMFALMPSDVPASNISLKCDPMRAASLREQYAEIQPGYHLNKKHWNTVQLHGDLTDEEIRMLIDHSYELVFKGLTKAEKTEIAR